MLTARPTIYRGIQMRSRLEAHVARWLDTHPSFLPWEYEPTCFAGIAGQYLPDFVLHHRNFDSYIEVKSHTVREGELEDIMRRMPVIWESQPRALLAIQLWDQRRDPPTLVTSLYRGPQRRDQGWSVNLWPVRTATGEPARFLYSGARHLRAILDR
jgi:hypothetical protein